MRRSRVGRYEPEPGEVIAREVRARDGRTVLQIRVELGVLQLEVGGRPDGTRPHGIRRPTWTTSATAPPAAAWPPAGKAPTLGRWHRSIAPRPTASSSSSIIAGSPGSPCTRYDLALRDADHTLALMDFVVRHGDRRGYIASHERFRGLVLFHRTQAAAALALDRRRPEEAIDVVRDGIERLARHQQWFGRGRPGRRAARPVA